MIYTYDPDLMLCFVVSQQYLNCLQIFQRVPLYVYIRIFPDLPEYMHAVLFFTL